MDSGAAASATHRERRKSYQLAGRQKFKEDLEFQRLCMLYWGEGTKSKGVIVFTNSDPDMMLDFYSLLFKCFSLKREDVTLRVNAYLNNGLSKEEIEGYWLNLLQIPTTQLRKGTFNSHSPSSKRLKRSLLYGTAAIVHCSTEHVQMIYGGISSCCSTEFKFLF